MEISGYKDICHSLKFHKLHHYKIIYDAYIWIAGHCIPNENHRLFKALFWTSQGLYPMITLTLKSTNILELVAYINCAVAACVLCLFLAVP